MDTRKMDTRKTLDQMLETEDKRDITVNIKDEGQGLETGWMNINPISMFMIQQFINTVENEASGHYAISIVKDNIVQKTYLASSVKEVEQSFMKELWERGVLPTDDNFHVFGGNNSYTFDDGTVMCMSKAMYHSRAR